MEGGDRSFDEFKGRSVYSQPSKSTLLLLIAILGTKLYAFAPFISGASLKLGF
jgi:hypothetical protein